MNLLIIFCAKYLLFLSAGIAVISFFMAGRSVKIKAFYLAATSSIIAVILTEVSARLIYDPRPFVVKNIQPLIQHASDNGFPSDHTLVAMLIASIVFAYNKKIGVILIVPALLIGISRVLAEVHHPLDIVGSITIAIISVVAGLFVIRFFANEQKLTESGRPKHN